MKCARCGLDVSLCDHPAQEYVRKNGKLRKEWYHECCARKKLPCPCLEAWFAQLKKEDSREQDP